MPTGKPQNNHPGFSPEVLRLAVRAHARVPERMLQRALEKVNEKMDAKETKFFAHEGMVVDQRVVDDNRIQLKAAELVLQVAEMMSQKQAPPQAARIRVVVDPVTGVMALEIGGDDSEASPAMIENITPEAMEAQVHVAAGEAYEPEVIAADDLTDSEFEKVIKVPRGQLSPEVRAALFGEPEVGT